ncbi:DUF4160 domain-containing protein [endosymbiont GvMRE of Glomus versiforme]|uniref:DUF4160 domain-containing protein n=1 Tax=endosymbiont GvMRE of Glomus versiforme TaxID=2039283 RepID=UPI000EC657F7|nr:DUF4160 domain-containing protein [endosymbiont GvMRE of Glomus versiforme]RHZ37387.1 PF13711 domain protein [endosymbiont GvMRE of Glomus versiforme]
MSTWIDCPECDQTFWPSNQPICPNCKQVFEECPECEEELSSIYSCSICRDWKDGGRDGYDKREPLYAPGSNYDDGLEYRMDTVHEDAGFRFFFTGDDLIGDEPPHIHIKRKHGGRDRAKIWLRNLEWHHCYGFNSSEQRRIMNIVEEKQEFFLEEWERLRR